MKTILVPTDFSAPSRNAVKYAAELAKQFGSKLVLLNAYSIPVSAYDTIPPVDLLSSTEESAKELLAQMAESITSESMWLKVDTIQRIGSAQGVIAEVAAEVSADAIVMGIVGEAGKVKERLIGSTTLDVARDIEKPLYIIPEGVEFKKVGRISFACDIENMYGSRILDEIKSICKQFSAALEIVNIEKPLVESDPLWIRNRNFMESVLNDINHETVVLNENDALEALQKYFANHHADLIVLNPKKQNFFQSLFHKSVTKALAFHVKSPMLIVH